MQPGSRVISGRYRGTSAGKQVELRVDVEDPRLTKRISGDVFRISNGRALDYSFVMDVSPGGDSTLFQGMARFSTGGPDRMIRVVIFRIPASPNPVSAMWQRLRGNGTVEEEILCDFESGFFRTIEIKEDIEAQVEPFRLLQTRNQPPEAPARLLTIAKAFEEAGVELRPASEPPASVPLPPGDSWSDAELNLAMVNAFQGLDATNPAWKLWFLHAFKHEKAGTDGVMFDTQGLHRQGCAVFYERTVNDPAPSRRKQKEQLRSCIHELGHCLNLPHAFEVSPLLPGPRSQTLSWMNYPKEIQPGGAPQYWRTFPLAFDYYELGHLRHAFLHDIIPGGRRFEGGTELHDSDSVFHGMLDEASDLQLRLEAPAALDFGEPVWVDIRLSWKGEDAVEIHPHLHPRQGFVQILIQGPGGGRARFQPLFRRRTALETLTLDEDRPAVYDSAYLGFGKPGFYFTQPGIYQIRAVYTAPNDSLIVSNVLPLRIRSPFTREDDEVAGLILGEEQGQLIAFRGSDGLEAGNSALNQIIEYHSAHPFASYARMVQGSNRAREFKTIEPSGALHRRRCDIRGAQEILQPMVDAFVSGRSEINNITFSRTMRHLAERQIAAKDKRGARATLEPIPNQIAARREVREKDNPLFQGHVLKAINAQVNALLEKT